MSSKGKKYRLPEALSDGGGLLEVEDEKGLDLLEAEDDWSVLYEDGRG
jgi:hypothetical protein